MLIGVPKEIKTHEYRVGLVPASVRELVLHGHQVIGRDRRRRRHRHRRRGLPRRRCQHRRHAGRDLRDGRDDREGEGAAAARVPAAARGPDPVHLPPPRRRPAAGRGADAVRLRRHRLRDRHRPPRPPAAAGADERGRGPDERPGRRPSAWRRCRAAPACCSAACPASTPPRWSWSAAASPAPTPSAWRWAWRRRSTCSTRAWSGSSELDLQFGPMLNTIYSTVDAIEQHVATADLVIGAVLVPGATAPKLITRDDAAPDAAGLGVRRHRDRPGRLCRDLAGPPATPTRPMSRRASSTTASPTCRARCRAPRPSR